MFGAVYFLAFLCATALGAIVTPVDKDDGPLILTPYIENGETEKAKELSTVDPDLFADVQSHAGYFTVNKTAKWNLFFWYFPTLHRLKNRTPPLVVWLQGGPGGSSLYGLFQEIGPIQIVNNTAEKMPITWGSEYSLLFIDNPVGTGFSFTEGGEYATNEDEVGACLFSLIQQFLQVFPELRNAPLFLAGESYAGKYIPAFGHYIHINQKAMPINLKGLAIGDGWIDPPTLMHYSEWGLQMGFLDLEQAKLVHDLEEKARQYWDEGNYTAYTSMAKTAFEIFHMIAPVNVYNYLREISDETDKSFVVFLNRNDVQSALHVKKINYKDLNDDVYNHLEHEMYDTVKPWLEELLEQYGVMCYNGQLDLIVAYALSVHTYRTLNWSGAQAYLDADRFPVYADDGTLTSFVKTAGNFMDVMVRGAGHMVPADKPRAAKQMIDMFIGSFLRTTN